MNKSVSCDIFCNVIDNYGDIGVSWRLARQLAYEFGLNVRLWVDDLNSFVKLCPGLDVNCDTQRYCEVEICFWPRQFPTTRIADLVIEAFACTLPESYVNGMVLKPPVWINLEYLSAEDWVAGCHRLPSPHPRLPLTKYFFFPGFTPHTGGLLLEHDLLSRRDEFLRNTTQQQAFWQSIGLPMPDKDTQIISLFSYENAALPALLDTWARGEQSVLCLVPEGRILPQLIKYFDEDPGGEGCYFRGQLQVCVLPFVRQERYDELLWACDVNFVRGEDSCVRAQWAGKPFIWQIYPQHDAVHWQKLQAFLDLYMAPLNPAASLAMQGMWQAWNDEAGQASSIKQQWGAFAREFEQLKPRAQTWVNELAENTLTLNLLAFCQEIGRIDGFKIDRQ